MARRSRPRRSSSCCLERVQVMSRLIVGVDEAGRGPLAGPVVAAAVILDPERPVAGLADSKALGAAERERLALLLQERALGWCVAIASPAEIDAINILQATMLAMRRAALGLLVGREFFPLGAADASEKDGVA